MKHHQRQKALATANRKLKAWAGSDFVKLNYLKFNRRVDPVRLLGYLTGIGALK
jgi:hypothetical protein